MFLALLLPVMIFLFLKTFGKNEFEVPVLFADSVGVACEEYTYKIPYVIEDSVLKKLSWNEEDSLTIIVFEDGNTIDQHERKIQMERVFTEFKNTPLQIVRISGSSRIAKSDNRIVNISLSEPDFQRMRDCNFLLSGLNNTVIIDRHKRIRGQYNLLKREDADRMIMQEMNILLKRY